MLVLRFSGRSNINLYSELCALNSLVSIRYLKKNHYGLQRRYPRSSVPSPVYPIKADQIAGPGLSVGFHHNGSIAQIELYGQAAARGNVPGS